MDNTNEDKSIDTEFFNKRLMGNVVRLPFEVVTASGATLNTSIGALLDFWGDEGVCSLGYNTKEYLDIVDNFRHSCCPHQLPDVYPHFMRYNAAEIICSMTSMDRIFFANSGTEANEAAIKIARKYWWDKLTETRKKELIDGGMPFHPRRYTVLTIAGNFHGRTGLSLAAGDPRVSPYHRWGFGPSAAGFGVLDDITWKQVVTDGQEHTPVDVDWYRVAAVTFAPVLGNNVVKTYGPEFWQKLQQLRKEHGFLIIHDDVQAGSGRSGYPATYQGIFPLDLEFTEEIKPDILCLGKGMALGYPMSAMLASEEVSNSFTPGVHFNTFGGSPFVCYCAVAYYEWLGVNLHLIRSIGQVIRNRFAEMNWIVEWDGMGMLNAFTPDYSNYNGYDFCHQARKFGLSLVTHRKWGPIRFTPPMNVSVKDLEFAFDALEKTHIDLSK